MNKAFWPGHLQQTPYIHIHTHNGVGGEEEEENITLKHGERAQNVKNGDGENENVALVNTSSFANT